MATNRIARISGEYMKALSEVMRTLKDPRIRGLVSITRCDVTGDLRYANVYISVLGATEAEKKDVLKGLKSATGYLRREVSRKVELRAAPEPIFKLDDSIKRGTDLLAVLNTLDIPEYTEDPDARENGEDDDEL